MLMKVSSLDHFRNVKKIDKNGIWSNSNETEHDIGMWGYSLYIN